MQIKLEKISKSYVDGDHSLVILDQVDFCFEPGKAYAIVGPSGIGKSTLLNIIAGLDYSSSGKVSFDSICLTDLSEDDRADLRGSSIGFVFQFHHLLPEFSARENVAIPLLLAGQAESHAFSSADQLLQKVGLKDRLHHRPSQLSGGEQQRVAIARAVVTRPRVLLCDEPTGNLDSHSAEEIRSLIRQMQKELRSTLICVTHSRELAATMDYTYEMKPGGGLHMAGSIPHEMPPKA